MSGLPRIGEIELNRAVFPKIERLNCDHVAGILELARCRIPPTRSPRLLVPAKALAGAGVDLGRDYRHLHADFVTIHYCHRHEGELTLETVWRTYPRLKADLEAGAKRRRPHDFKCDFDAAHIVYVDIFSPQYKAFQLVKHLPRSELQETWGSVIARD